MSSILIQLDDQTLSALNRVAEPGNRQRSEFIRQAIRSAIRKAEYKAIREAYAKQPDSESEADAWSTVEEFRP
jgi:metal-responsive CopG/Arc/MetJ family transcriptional regulator